MPNNPTWEETEEIDAGPSWDETSPESVSIPKPKPWELTVEGQKPDIGPWTQGPQQREEALAIYESMLQPPVTIPEFKGTTPVGKVAAGLGNVAGGLINMAASPVGLVTLPLAATPIGGPVIGGVFGGLAAKRAGETLGEASVTGDLQKYVEGGAEALMAPLMAHPRFARVELPPTIPAPVIKPVLGGENVRFRMEGAEDLSRRPLKAPKPVVPETVEELTPTVPETVPIQPEIATWEDAVTELKTRGTGTETKAQIQGMFPQLNLSKESAGGLAKDAWGENWKPAQQARQPAPEIKAIAAETKVEPEVVEKGVRVEANDHPEVAKSNPELLPTLVKDELEIDKKAYDKDVDPAKAAEPKKVQRPTKLKPGFVRLWRGGTEGQEGLWFSDTKEVAEFHFENHAYDKPATLSYVDIPEADSLQYSEAAFSHPDVISKKTIAEGGDHVLPPELAAQAKVVKRSQPKPTPPPPSPEAQAKPAAAPTEAKPAVSEAKPSAKVDKLNAIYSLSGIYDKTERSWKYPSREEVLSRIEQAKNEGIKIEYQAPSKPEYAETWRIFDDEGRQALFQRSPDGRTTWHGFSQTPVFIDKPSGKQIVPRQEIPQRGTGMVEPNVGQSITSTSEKPLVLEQPPPQPSAGIEKQGKEGKAPIVIGSQAGVATESMLARRDFLKANPSSEQTLSKKFSYSGMTGLRAGPKSRFEYVEEAVSRGDSKEMFLNSGLKVTKAEEKYFDFLQKRKPEPPTPGPGAQTVGETPIAQGPGARTAKAEVPESYEGTGLKNAIGEVERVSYGLPEATPTEKRAMGKAWIRSELLLEKDPLAGQKLLDALAENPKRGLSDDESALLLRHKVKIENDLNAAAERTFTATDDVAKAHAQAEFNVLSDQLLKMLDAAKERGSEWGREGRWRQAIANEDFSLATMVMRKRMALGGRKLTEPEMDAVKKAQAEVEATRKAYEKHVEESKAREEELQKQIAFEKARAEAKEPEIHPKIIQIAETIVKQLDNKADAARARIKARMSRMSAGVDPTVILDLTEIGASHLAHRVLDFAKWSDRMIGEFGDWVKPHLNEVFKNAQLRIDALAEAHGKQRAPQIKKALEKPTLEETKIAIAEKVKERVAKKEFNKITWYLNLLARRLYESGVTEREPMVDALHDVLKSVMPEVTRQETARMWSGYGDYRQLSKDQISVGLRSMKGELLEISKLEDMEAGQPPLKSGHERGEISEARRQLIKKVNDAKYKFQIPIQDPATQLKSALDTYKTILTNRIADLEDRMARKDFAPRPRRELILDEKAFELRAKAERVKQRYNRELEKDRKSRQAPWQRRLEKFVEWERAFKLSSPVVFGKLGAAAVTRGVTTGTEEALGSILKRMPVISKVAGQAPREGAGLSLQAASKAIASAVTEGIKDAKQTAKTGMTDLDILLGKEGGLDREWVNMFGQLHGMVKAPVKRAEYTYSLEQRIAHAIRNGEDVLNKQVMQRLMTESMNDGYRSIFMQKGFSSQMFTAMVHMMESSKSYQPIGEISARLTRFLLPIVRVPVNIVGETMTGVTGIPLASTRIMFHAMKGGLKNMDPVVADSIMRQLKKGSIGAALMAIGFMNPENVGGYDWKQKRKPGEVKSGGFQIFGKDVPRWVTHAPWFELMQMGGTIRRVSEEKYKEGTKGIGAGILAAQVGLLEETPFYGQMVRTVRAGESAQAANRAAGELARSTVVPQFFQQIAKLTDKEEKRKPTTLWEHIKYGIPGLRNTVPVKPPTNSGVSAVMFPK